MGEGFRERVRERESDRQRESERERESTPQKQRRDRQAARAREINTLNLCERDRQEGVRKRDCERGIDT